MLQVAPAGDAPTTTLKQRASFFGGLCCHWLPISSIILGYLNVSHAWLFSRLLNLRHILCCIFLSSCKIKQALHTEENNKQTQQLFKNHYVAQKQKYLKSTQLWLVPCDCCKNCHQYIIKKQQPSNCCPLFVIGLVEVVTTIIRNQSQVRAFYVASSCFAKNDGTHLITNIASELVYWKIDWHIIVFCCGTI